MTQSEIKIVEIEAQAAISKLIAHYDQMGGALRSEGCESAAQELEARAHALRNLRDNMRAEFSR